MRILLVGEYSRFHNSLKKGLLQLGHDVILIGDNDFKNYWQVWHTFLQVWHSLSGNVCHTFYQTDCFENSWQVWHTYLLFLSKLKNYEVWHTQTN